jgi:hypothetical protein
MKSSRYVTFSTDLKNPSFAKVAEAMGMLGARVERPEQLEPALRAAFSHKGPALIEVLTHRLELAMPPTITIEEAKGFSLYMLRTVMNGPGRRTDRLGQDKSLSLRGEIQFLPEALAISLSIGQHEFGPNGDEMTVRSYLLLLLVLAINQFPAFLQSSAGGFVAAADIGSGSGTNNDNTSADNNALLPWSLTRPVLRDINEFSIYTGQSRPRRSP